MYGSQRGTVYKCKDDHHWSCPCNFAVLNGKIYLRKYLSLKVASTSFLPREAVHYRTSRARDTRERGARLERRKIKTNMATRSFFVLGYFCSVLKEIREYPRLYILERP